MSEESNARELISQAEKKLKGGIFSSPKYDEGAELYTKAGNVYKMTKRVGEAAECYMKAANCYLQAKSGHEAANAYINAANVYRKTNPLEAVKCLEKAGQYYAQEGRWSMAAKNMKEIAEIYEKEAQVDKACEAYEKAAEYYEGDNAPSSSDTCLTQVALLSAQEAKYAHANKIYDQLATNCLDSKLRHFNFRDFAFRAVLCQLANQDVVSAKRSIEKYHGMDSTFATTREYKLLIEISNAVENFDAEAFTTAVQDFDSVIKLDQWKSTILLRIRDTIPKQDEAGLT